jgi:membrane fusion protein, copper/silver efflux system
MTPPESLAVQSSQPSHRHARVAWRAAGVVLARGRFVLLVGGLLALIALWPFLQNTWDKFTRTTTPHGAVSADTEYWCPMCPGVVSDWPSKCPVCSMSLVRREKGEMTPLPDGVVARVQLSPYRLQLAGIRTSPVEFLRLEHEVVAGGLLETESGSPASSSLVLTAEVFERDAASLSVGQEALLSCDACPGETFPARITELTPAAIPAAGRRVRVRVEDSRGELRPGHYAAAKFRIPVARLDAHRRAELDRWRNRAAVASSFAAVGRLDGFPPVEGPLFTLLEMGLRQAAAREGYVLSVPESAVIDTGTRRVVYVETMEGMFDAVEVRLGRRCGDHYPVRAGLELGQRVASAGAVLLDAETRLNPNVAAAYFGSGPRNPTGTHPPPGGSVPSGSDDRQLIARQKVCPVSGGDLDSMGGPVRLVVDGRVVFICCDHCEKSLRQKPALYLPKLPK